MLYKKILHKIEDVPRHEWDKVFPQVLDGYQFFKSLDESGFEQFSFRYILIYDDQTLVGAAPCFVMDYPLDTSISGPIKRFLNISRKYFPGIFSIKAVVCGVPMGQGKVGIVGKTSEIMDAIYTCLDSIAKDEKARIIAFKDFTRDYAGLLSYLLKNGFTRFDSLPSAEMEIDFESFDEYMMKLSHKTRYDLRRKFRKVEGRAKIEMEVVKVLSDKTLQEVYRLYRGAVSAHDDTGFEKVPLEFFKNISKNMPDETRFFLWKMNGKIVAFVFALVSEDFLSTYYLGLDYSVAYDYHLYFIRFRDIMNWCIKNGIKKCDVGVTGYEPKKRLDFGFVPLHIYAKHRSMLIRPFFNLLCTFLKFEHFDPLLKEIKRTDQ